MPTTIVDWTVNVAQPETATCGDDVRSVVEVPVFVSASESVEPVPVVFLLPAASLTQTVTVDVEAPFAGIGFGDAVAVTWVAAPLPVQVRLVVALETLASTVSWSVRVQVCASVLGAVNVLVPLLGAAAVGAAGAVQPEPV